MEKKKIIIIGCGSRGEGYSRKGYEQKKFDVVAIAEPIENRRRYLQDRHNIPDELAFETWEPLLEMPKMADAAIIATMDRDHFAPAMAAIEKGYHLLLEKPVSPLPEECMAIEKAAKEKGVSVIVCHVLRYTPFFRAIKNVIDQGTLGEVVNIQHIEPVGNVHQSHSFVRGKWKNSEESSCMILQKSCHDTDIVQWLIGKECTRVQSFGSLTYFKRENAPKGSPDYCIEGCPKGDTCPYNAVKLYLENQKNTWFRRASTHKMTPTDEDVAQVLRTTEYGKCVFKCSNNVVDHQVVNMEFEGGATCSFTMCAFATGERSIRIMGTKGELRGVMGQPTLQFYDFETKKTIEIEIADKAVDGSIVGGHGGGDDGIIGAFYDMLNGKDVAVMGDISVSVKSHMIAFAAERSRLEGRVVEVSELYN